MRSLSLLLMLTVMTGLVAADLPEAATVTRPDGSTMEGQVVSESLDEVKMRLGTGDNAAETVLARNKVKSIEYGNIADLDYVKAVGAKNKNDWDKAAAGFLMAAKATQFARVRELSYIEAAQAFEQLNKPDDALKAIAELQTKAPRSVQLPVALQVKARVLAAKGDAAGAEATAKELEKFAPVGAAVVRAELLRKAGKSLDAAKQMQAVWGTTLTATSDPSPGEPEFADVGFQIADDLGKGGDAEGARSVLDALGYSAISKSMQAKAHRMLAESYAAAADKASLIKAFDHAMIAAALSRNEKSAVKRLCIKLLSEFDKDPNMKDEVTEYRGYVNAL